MFRTNCLICGNENLAEIIDLGSHPFADTFVSKEALSQADKVYPLVLDMCEKCYCIQSRTVTQPSERYEEQEYSYTSSNSAYARRHWESFAEEVPKTLCLKNGNILEIGSNDGYLLEQFAKHGHSVMGVDASRAMCKLADERGVPTFHALFDQEWSSKVGNKFDLIVANNVFNHANDPLDFVRAIEPVLAENGSFVFEVPYWVSGVEQYRFDQIYHEHVTYYTASHVVNLFEENGIYVNSIEIVDYHGGSLRVFASRKRRDAEREVLGLRLMMRNEERFMKPDYYVNLWMPEIKKRRNTILADIYNRSRNGETFVAIGAAAKGNTFLNYYNLDASVIDFVTDASPHKIGKWTPKTRIPIVGDSEVANIGPANAIVLSWNLPPVLKEKLIEINPELKFL